MIKHKFSGKTIEEAKSIAIEELNTTEENLIIKETEIKGGLFKSKKIEIEVVTIEELIEFIKDYLMTLIKNIGLEVNLEVKTRDENVTIIMHSNNNGILIGKNGRTIDALTTIVRQKILLELNTYYNLTLDVGEYKQKKQKDLERLAKLTAKEVAKTKIDAKLDPMNSYERRIIHNTLTNSKDVYTESEGTEPNRYIVIKAKETN